MTTALVENAKIDAKFVLELQATLLSHASFDEAATALATDLAIKLGLERVSIGLTEHGQTQIKAISHSTDVKAKHEAHRIISAAMDEAIEQSTVIVYPETDGNQPRVIMAHSALTRTSGNQGCTIPLINNGHIFGAILLEHSFTSKFKKDEICTLENIISILAPILQLKWNDEDSWFNRFKRDWSTRKLRYFAKANTSIRLSMYALSIALVALLIIPMEYNISAPARLEGSIQRALVAPENGYLKQAYVYPGDKVQKNQLLAELADQELQLEIRRWQSELAQSKNAFGASLAQSDRVQMAINQAKTEGARTELVLAEEKLSRSRIVAPFDGIIIKGDLKQSLGAPLQRGDILLTIAPIDSFRLIIEVDERDVSDVQPNQEGKVALVSLPGKVLAFNVQSITPVATSKEGRNFFEVKGMLKNTDKISLRPGLEGVAKIKAGKRSLIWKLTHRAIDWARLTLWAWGV